MSKDGRDADFNVAKLTSYLEFMLENTDKVRKCVTASCEETRKVVKCWTFPDRNEDSLAVNTAECTCHISAFDESSEEIAKGIGHIVENAQKLREKITAKNPSVNTIKQIPKRLTAIKGANSNTGPSPAHFPRGARNGLSNTSISRLPFSRATSTNIGKNPPLPVSKVKSVPSSQSTYQKDFASRPSSRLSNDSAKSSTSTTKPTVKCINKSEDRPITMAQLEELLDRVAVDATLYSSQKNTANIFDAPKEIRLNPCETCPIHGNIVPGQSVQVSLKHVEFKEAISIVGVPSKLVKILQPYHRFLSQQETGAKPTEPKSATKFLSELNNMNKSNWDKAMYEPLVGVFANYLPLCSKVSQLTGSGERISPKDSSRIRVNLEKLETAYRNCLGKEISASVDMPLITPRQEAHDLETNHAALMLAGIWNDQSISLQGMADAVCTRYNNMKQIKCFYQNIQQIQRLDFQLHILDLITNEILPQLCHIDGNHAAFFLTIKTLIALCDLQHFQIPVIVKSN